MASLVDYWPIAGLVVRSPRLELRTASDDDLAELAAVAAAGIHDPGSMPFGVPWTRQPPGDLERKLLQFHWLKRADWTPESWNWNPVTVVVGQVVGTQGISATQFGLRWTVDTGSWIGQRYQGQGIGTEMRACILHFAFAGLGAHRAETSAAQDNPASLRVTRKLGYRPNGTNVHAIEGHSRLELRFVLERDDWETTCRSDIEIEGLDPCLDLFGAVQPNGDHEREPPTASPRRGPLA